MISRPEMHCNFITYHIPVSYIHVYSFNILEEETTVGVILREKKSVLNYIDDQLSTLINRKHRNLLPKKRRVSYIDNIPWESIWLRLFKVLRSTISTPELWSSEWHQFFDTKTSHFFLQTEEALYLPLTPLKTIYRHLIMKSITVPSNRPFCLRSYRM